MSGGFPVPEYNNCEAFFEYILPCAQLQEGGVVPHCHIPGRSYGILSQGRAKLRLYPRDNHLIVVCHWQPREWSYLHLLCPPLVSSIFCGS